MLRVEEARARLGLDKESAMLTFEKQLDGQLKQRVELKKALCEMDALGILVTWGDVVRAARELCKQDVQAYNAATPGAER